MEGELCEIDGYGSVALSVIEDLMATGNTFIAAVLLRSDASKVSITTAGDPTPTRRPRSNSSTPNALSRDARPETGSKQTTAKTGPRPTSRCSTYSTTSAAFITNSRLIRDGPSSKGGASATSFRPTIPVILDASAPTVRARRLTPTDRRALAPPPPPGRNAADPLGRSRRRSCLSSADFTLASRPPNHQIAGHHTQAPATTGRSRPPERP